MIAARYYWLHVLACALLLAGSAAAGAPTTIGLLLDGPQTESAAAIQAVEKEVRDLAQGGLAFELPPAKRIEGDWSITGARAALDRLLKDAAVDIVLTLGPLGSTDACRRGALSKPVIALFAADREIAQWPRKQGGSGVPNLAYVTAPGSFKRDLELLKKLAPVTALTVLVPPDTASSLPGLGAAAEALGMNASIVSAAASVSETLSLVPAGAQAVYLDSGIHFEDDALKTFLNSLADRHLPVFAAAGRSAVELGALASALPGDDLQRRVRRAALYVRRIALGEAPETLPVDLPLSPKLTVNMATARSLGLSPAWDLRTDAELLNDQPENADRQITLAGTVQEAITANLDLKAADKNVSAGAQNIREAKSKLRPLLEASALALNVDGDRAQASNGLQPEWSFKTSLTLTQVLYAEPAYANIEAQKHLQHGREMERERQRLDLVLETATAYVNVLRARAYERITTDLLKRVREHQQTARIRREAGIAGPVEVNRWQAEVANARKAVTDAGAKSAAAQIALNRLLDRPQTETFEPAEITPRDTAFAGDDGDLARLLNTPKDFEQLRDFLLREGISRSPELAQYDAGIAAQSRALESYERSFYVPIIAAQAQISQDLYKAGKGSTSDLPLPLPIKITLSELDDTEWQVGIKASLPLYSGGARKAARIKAEETLSRLKIERSATAAKLEQAIRSAAQLTQSSYVAILQAREAADAAKKTYDVVKNAYAQGEASMLELLDAQTARAVTEELAMNAFYEYLAWAVKTQRASNSFDFLMTTDERLAWRQRLEAAPPQ